MQVNNIQPEKSEALNILPNKVQESDPTLSIESTYFSGSEADDEAEPLLSLRAYLPFSTPMPDLSLVSSSDTDISSHSHLSLPWYEEGASSQMVQRPSVIETSKWSKLVMVKACKAFGISVAGFEHELLDMILRMEERRQIQLQQQKATCKKKKKSKDKQRAELDKLICGINYDGKNFRDRGRFHKSFSE